jgi:hypothetical protein
MTMEKKTSKFYDGLESLLDKEIVLSQWPEQWEDERWQMRLDFDSALQITIITPPHSTVYICIIHLTLKSI